MYNNTPIIKKKKKHTITSHLSTLFVILILLTVSYSTASITTNQEQTQPAPLQRGWEFQQCQTIEGLTSVGFTSITAGSAVGINATIINTDDAGETWNPQTCSVSTNFFDISMNDSNTGMIVGQEGTILRTNNGGTTWNTVQTGWMTTYLGAHMVSNTVGFAVGVNTIFQPLVTWTTNGWSSINNVAFYLIHQSSSHEGTLHDVHFLDITTGFIAASVWTSEGAIARTTNGGWNWETIYWTNRALYGIDFPSDTVGYAVGLNGIIIKTIDSGATWNVIESGVSDTLFDVSFVTNTVGTIVGENGLILRTEDGGTTWIIQDSGTTYDLFAVQFITSNIGFAVGEHGTVLHTTTGGYQEDTTPPETTCTLKGQMNGSIYISDVTVTLTATDNESGINYTRYRLDTGSYTLYTSPFIVLKEGEHTMYFYSVDHAGNIEDEKTCTFEIQHPTPLDITINGGIGITVGIKNTGASCMDNIPWSINVTNGFIIFGKTKTGTIPQLCPGNTTMIHSMVFGFGKSTIMVTVDNAQKKATGFVLLFFVLSVTPKKVYTIILEPIPLNPAHTKSGTRNSEISLKVLY